MTDLLMTAKLTQCIPQIKTVTTNIIPWSFYMYSILWSAGAAVLAAVAGYFVGKRGLTRTKTDLTNAASKVEAVATEIKAGI